MSAFGSHGGDSPRLRIIIPAKNEANRIEATIREYCSYFGERAIVHVVANGCSDETVTIVKRLQATYPTLALMNIGSPVGKGGAIRAGMTVGDEPFVAFVDADGSAKAPQLDALARRCAERGVAGVIGSRWMSGSSIARKQPLKRRIASRAFNALVRLMFGLEFTDTQCGAKVFSREAIVGVLDHLEVANFAFDVDLLVAMQRFRFPVIEVPIVWADEPGDSKVRIVTAGSSMVASLVRLWLRRSPLGQLPFVDRYGRGAAIPVMRGLTILVLEREPDPSGTLEIVRAIRARGHYVTVFRIAGTLDALRFAWWYLSFGHRAFDVIVDLLGGFLSRILTYSAKPRIVGPSATELLGAPLDEALTRAIHACGYHAVFWRGEDGWRFPALAGEPVGSRSGSGS